MRRLYSVAFWVALGLLPFAARAQGTPKIVVVGLSAAHVSELKAAARASFVSVLSPAEALQQIGNADGLMGICNRDLVRAGKKLRWIQVYSAGVERYRFPELLNSNITLTNAKIIQGPEIADHADQTDFLYQP